MRFLRIAGAAAPRRALQALERTTGVLSRVVGAERALLALAVEPLRSLAAREVGEAARHRTAAALEKLAFRAEPPAESAAAVSRVRPSQAGAQARGIAVPAAAPRLASPMPARSAATAGARDVATARAPDHPAVRVAATTGRAARARMKALAPPTGWVPSGARLPLPELGALGLAHVAGRVAGGPVAAATPLPPRRVSQDDRTSLAARAGVRPGSPPVRQPASAPAPIAAPAWALPAADQVPAIDGEPQPGPVGGVSRTAPTVSPAVTSMGARFVAPATRDDRPAPAPAPSAGRGKELGRFLSLWTRDQGGDGDAPTNRVAPSEMARDPGSIPSEGPGPQGARATASAARAPLAPPRSAPAAVGDEPLLGTEALARAMERVFAAEARRHGIVVDEPWR